MGRWARHGAGFEEARLTEPVNSKNTGAEGVFTGGGFLIGVLPLILLVYAVAAGAMWFLTSLKNTDIGLVGVFVIPFVFVVVRLLVRYMVAGDAHNELKEKYGELYAEKIRRGEIRLNAVYVLLYRAPERYADMLKSHPGPAVSSNE